MLRNPWDVMTAGIREMLTTGFGKQSIVDVLEGTGLGDHRKRNIIVTFGSRKRFWEIVCFVWAMGGGRVSMRR